MPTTNKTLQSQNERFQIIYKDPFPLKDIVVGHMINSADFDTLNSLGTNNFLFLYVVKGEGVVEINGQSLQFAKNDTVFINKDTFFHFSALKGVETEVVYFSFTAEYVYYMTVEFSLLSGVYFINSCEHFLHVLKICRIEQDENTCYIIADKVNKIIMLLATNFLNKPLSLSSKIKMLLDTHVYDPLFISDILQSLHISKSTLMRTFKKAYSLTPHEYLIQKRLLVAKELLTTSKLALKNIAYLLCFSDERYFSYCFTQKMGVSPSEYRNNTNAFFDD